MAMISLVGESVAGGIIQGPGAITWTIQGKPISLLNDGVQGHGNGAHSSPRMAQGTTWFTWNGIPVVCSGCQASCGHVANGNPWMVLPLI